MEGYQLGNLGQSYSMLGEYDHAVNHFTQARAIFKSLRLGHLVRRINISIFMARSVPFIERVYTKIVELLKKN